MKRFLAFLCVIALVSISAAPALANPSIGYVSSNVEVIEILSDAAHATSAWIAEQLSGGEWYLKVIPYNAAMYDNADVKDIITGVNSDSLVIEPYQFAASLKKYQPEELAQAAPEQLSRYHFVTRFKDLVLTDGTQIVYMHGDNVMSVRARMQADAMMGVKKSDLGNYLVMQVNPATGEIFYTAIEEDSFVSKDGSFVTEAKVLGPFAIIQKI